MTRTYMKLRTIALRTGLGKKVRHLMQKRSFKLQSALNSVNKHFPELSDEEKNKVALDMFNESQKYNLGYSEYIMYHFKDKPFEERRQFISTRERALYCERFNKAKNQMIFDDKGETYKVFKKYFKRDLVEIVKWNKKSVAEFEKFLDKHNRFIIKPFNGGNGVGIKIADLADKSRSELLDELKRDYRDGFVAEELIKQCSELAKPHPESVNTVRITTVRLDDRVEFLPSFWRVGRGDLCVDNGGCGGIICALNDEGEIIKTCDEKGISYDVHPETGHPLIGFKIPRFKEAKEFAKELAMVVPDNRYCGWDIALTDDGWIMQEGNWQGGMVGFQCTLQKGCREQVDALIKELNL